jgi:hypothetical protein
MRYRVANVAGYGTMLADNVSNARRTCLKRMK